MKFLIVVNWYPPDKEVAARRWGNLVFELQNSGLKCTVVIVGPDEIKSYQGISGENILNFNSAKNYSLKVSQQKKANRTSYLIMKLKRQIFKFVPDYIISRYFRTVQINKKIINSLNDAATDSDFVISSFGEWNAFILGYQIALKYDKPWIADIRDWFEHKTYYNKPRPIKYIDRLLTMKLLQQASLRLTIGYVLSNFLSGYYKSYFHAIYNGWIKEDVLSPVNESCLTEKYLIYAGTIYDHQLSALHILLEALESYPKIYLKIRLLKDSTQIGLKRWLEKHNYADRVLLLPPANIEVIEHELAISRGVVVIEDVINLNKAKLGTVTGKLLGLLVSGKPGIAIASKNSEINLLTEKANGWYCVDNVHDCIKAIGKITNILALIDNTDGLMDYNMQVQSSKLLQLIKSIHNPRYNTY